MPVDDPTDERIDLSRRWFLRAAGAAATIGFSSNAVAQPSSFHSTDSWDARANTIIRQTEEPEFPEQDFPVTEYGAVGDGEIDNSDSFAEAIVDCTESGGGRVIVPEGVYFHVGPIHLDNNVNLHVSEDAAIKFSTDPNDYLPPVYTRYEGIELMGRSPFIYAYEKENIAITGGGLINGQASEEHWWNWSDGDEFPYEGPDKQRLSQMAESGVPVEERIFGKGHYLRPNLVQPYKCEKVLIEGVTVKDSPMWNIHPVLTSDVTVRNITVDSPHGPNNDGCNPESCTNVLIQQSEFNTGDDCIGIKSGKNADGRRVDVPCRKVVIEDCNMADGNGGVTIGSEMTGGIEKVFSRNCQMSSPNLERALRFKTNPERGGYIRKVFHKNHTVGQTSDAAIEIALNYANISTGSYYPDVEKIHIKDLTVQETLRALYFIGLDNAPIQKIHLQNCIFENTEEKNIIQNVEKLYMDDVVIEGQQFDNTSDSSR